MILYVVLGVCYYISKNKCLIGGCIGCCEIYILIDSISYHSRAGHVLVLARKAYCYGYHFSINSTIFT